MGEGELGKMEDTKFGRRKWLQMLIVFCPSCTTDNEKEED